MATQLDPDDANVRAAVLGRQVEQFLATDIGQYLIEHAKREEEIAVAELKAVDPLDSKAVIAAQLRARAADNLSAWLGEAIMSGESAKLALEQERAEQPEE